MEDTTGSVCFSARGLESAPSEQAMQIGVYLPQYELPPDAEAMRDYVRGVEELGFNHLIIMDHVVGANKASRPNWKATYHLDTIFHEPFTLIAFLSGITRNLGFITGVLVLPQRQTTLVA
jgi:alkanesulfonate monooxygenase SsuD/methylene tetrahydromethanopterin reductase-like flavin-dependent oxidoreductase (luciferase family)